MAFGMMKCLFVTALPGRGVLDGQRTSMWRASSGPGALPACGAQRRNKCAHRRILARSLEPPCVIALTYPPWRRGEQAWRRRIPAICLLAGGGGDYLAGYDSEEALPSMWRSRGRRALLEGAGRSSPDRRSGSLVPGTGIEPVWLAPRDFRHTAAFAAG